MTFPSVDILMKTEVESDDQKNVDQSCHWRDDLTQGAVAGILLYSQLPQERREWIAEKVAQVQQRPGKWTQLVDGLAPVDAFSGTLATASVPHHS